MELTMAKGFSELNEQEMMEVDGGSATLLYGTVIALMAIIVAVESGYDNGRAAGKKEFDAQLEEEKYRNSLVAPTPCPAPTPIPTN